MISERKSLVSNLWKIGVCFITQRRIFWPILTVYFLTFPSNTVKQIGLFLAIGQIGGLLLELPSGYISDHIGHKDALVIARVSTLISTFLFFIGGDFYIFAVAACFFTIGIAFTSGTQTAFIHETLLALQKDHKYTEIVGQLKSKTFYVSAMLLAVVPWTASFNFRIPFAVGMIFDLLGLIITISLYEPKQYSVQTEEIKKENIFTVFSEGKKRNFYYITFYASLLYHFGIVAAYYRDVYQTSLGIDVAYLGILFALSRVMAAVVSQYIHLLEKKFSPRQYLLLLGVFHTICILLLGFFPLKYFVAILFIIHVGVNFGATSLRERAQLAYLKTSSFRATLLSLGNLFGGLANALMCLLIGFLIGQYSYGFGYMYFGIIGGAILFGIYLLYIQFGKLPPTET